MRSTILPVVLAVAAAGSLASQQTIVITGSVRDEVTGDGIDRVEIAHDGRVVARTGSNGTFRLPRLPVTGDEMILVFRRIGYAPRVVPVAIAGRESIELPVALRPVPTVLEEIVVDGRTLTIRNPGLVGFYNRRAEGLGRHLTQMEIDRAKSFDLTPYLRRLRLGDQRPCAPGAEMAVYLDGIRVPDFEVVNEILAPVEVGGIEFYPEEQKDNLPREYITPGVTCGTMLVWTRNPRGTSASLVGVHASSAWGGRDGRRTYVGGRLRFPLRDPPSTLALLISAEGTSTSGPDEVWRAFVTPILRPLGQGAPWYVGIGLGLARSPGDVGLNLHPALVSGVEARVASLRPFLEARAFGVDRPIVTVVTGLAIALGEGS